MRCKFEFWAEIIRGKIDILMAPERKVDESFPLGQVKIIDFNTPCRLDRIAMAKVLWFLYGNIYHLIASQMLPKEGLYVELELRKK